MDVQRKFLHFQLIDQIVDLAFQGIGKQDGRLDFSFSETGRTIFVCIHVHGRADALTGDLHQTELAERQNIMFCTVFLHVLTHAFVEFLPVFSKIHINEVDNDDSSHVS